jgi:hypothetical protein
MKSLPALITILSLTSATFLLHSCKHDPFADVVVADTTSLPTDTTGGGGDGGTGGGTGGGSNNDPCDPDSVYFEQDILPLLISNCAMSGCHDAVTAQDGINLTSYTSVMNTTEVSPFNPGNSELYKAITEDDLDDRMPPVPYSSLSADEIALIAKWINQGALNITCDQYGSGCDTANVTYSQTVSAILSQNCNGCHGGSFPSGGIDLTFYAGVATVAFDGRLLGAITHSSGFSPMPQSAPMLPDCEILQIAKWVSEGAQDN